MWDESLLCPPHAKTVHLALAAFLLVYYSNKVSLTGNKNAKCSCAKVVKRS